MKRQRGEFPWDSSLGKQNLNQVVVSSGFIEVGCSISRGLGHSYWGIFEKKKPFGSSKKKNPTFKARLSAKHMLIGQLHDDVILLQLQIKAIVL